MPVMNGIVAAQHIRALYRDVPIIMVTEHREQISREEAYRSGAQGYVLKGQATTDLPPTMRSDSRVSSKRIEAAVKAQAPISPSRLGSANRGKRALAHRVRALGHKPTSTKRQAHLTASTKAA